MIHACLGAADLQHMQSPGYLHAYSEVVVAVALKQRFVLGRLLQLHPLCTLCLFLFI